MSKRFPWNIVRGWKVSSLSNGNILIEPDYIPDPIEAGLAPIGVLDRMRLGIWVADRVTKRTTSARVWRETEDDILASDALNKRRG